MWNEYAREKIAELERQRRALPRAPEPTPRRSPAASAARAAGARIRRLGEVIERWGAGHETVPQTPSTRDA